ncbi:hypothetical protein Tco_1331402, partial [Tanacetum coccineum]
LEVLLESTESTLKEEWLISVTTNVNEGNITKNRNQARDCQGKVKSECKHLPIEESEFVSEVQILEVEPKIEKSNLKEICINISCAF